MSTNYKDGLEAVLLALLNDCRGHIERGEFMGPYTTGSMIIEGLKAHDCGSECNICLAIADFPPMIIKSRG